MLRAAGKVVHLPRIGLHVVKLLDRLAAAEEAGLAGELVAAVPEDGLSGVAQKGCRAGDAQRAL